MFISKFGALEGYLKGRGGGGYKSIWEIQGEQNGESEMGIAKFWANLIRILGEEEKNEICFGYT